MSRIETMEQLREEIRNLRQQQKQKEASIQDQLSQLRKQFKPLMEVVRFLGKGRSRWGSAIGGIKSWLLPGNRQKPIEVRLKDGESKRGLKELASDLFLNKAVQYALPYFLNRILFRSKLKASLVSLLEVALTEGAKRAFKHPKATLQHAQATVNKAGNALRDVWSKKAEAKRESEQVKAPERSR